jgi:hypothetical protein
MTADPKDLPDYISGAVNAMLPAIKLCRDVDEGYERIRAERTDYLPQHPKEDGGNYDIRLNRPVFYEAFSKTCDGLAGMVFRREPQLAEDVSGVIAEDWENIDQRGSHGAVFLSETFRDAMVGGHTIIFVDYPKASTARTLAEEQAQGLRPYWTRFQAEDVCNFRTTQVAGRTVLEQITLHEGAREPSGAFGEQKVDRYRVFQRTATGVAWETWEKVEGDTKQEALKKVDEGTLGNQTEIPAAVVYGHRKGVLLSKPPLKGLADANILHYQTNSDYHHAAHIANVPIPWIVGADAESLVISPNRALVLPEGASCGYMETAATALGHTRQMLQDIEARMATLGLNFLAQEKRAAETAAAKRIGKSEKDSALTRMARSLEDAVEQALGYHAKYRGLPEGGSCAVNRDYEDLSLEPAEMAEWSKLVTMGQISLDTMWAKFKQGEMLPPDFDPELEKTRLEAAMSIVPEEV